MVGGIVHLKLYNDGYKDFPDHNLGRSFLLNAAASAVIAVAIAISRSLLPLLAGLVLVDGTLLAFTLSRWAGHLRLHRVGLEPVPRGGDRARQRDRRRGGPARHPGAAAPPGHLDLSGAAALVCVWTVPVRSRPR